MLLAFLTFPHPAIGLWDGQKRLYHQSYPIQQAPCELILPEMVHSFQKKYALQDVKVLATCSGPGPFTALRIANAFAQGMGLGLSGAELVTPSFFDLFPNDKAAVHTGITQWILPSYEAVDFLPSDHIPISSSHVSEKSTLDLLSRLRALIGPLK